METDSSVRSALAQAMATRARALIGLLDDDQRRLATAPLDDAEERRRWFYTPTDHGGLPLSGMRPAQQQAVFQLVASGLSRAGYVTVSTIVGLDNVLDELEGWSSSWGRERGRDPGLYYLRIFGDPSPTGTWGWRFGGHHVSLSYTIVDGAIASVTPCFLGADPASSPLLGPHPLRPLAGAEDYARELFHALDEGQRSAALLSPIPPVDLVGANRSVLRDGDTALPLSEVWRGHFEGELADRVKAAQSGMEAAVGTRAQHLGAVAFSSDPKGLSARSMMHGQKAMLRRLLSVYLERMPGPLADAELAKFDGTRLDALSFAWAGSSNPGEPHYYRVQGPRLWVEYDNAARNANHVHTVWRDPEGDFGGDTLAAHYLREHTNNPTD